jgi:hypothetical protein
MSLAAGLETGMEIYSIDESFGDLTGVHGCLANRGFRCASASWPRLAFRVAWASAEPRRYAAG